MPAERGVMRGELVIGASGLFALVVACSTWFDADSSSSTSWSGSSLFAYAALLGFLVPVGVVALRAVGRRLPVTVLGASWSRVHLSIASFALVATIAAQVVGQDALAGVVAAAIGAVGMAVGAVLLSRDPVR